MKANLIDIPSEGECKRIISDMGMLDNIVAHSRQVRLNRYAFVSETPTDAEIVNYSDKRVLHDKIVPLNDRMEYILKKYGNTPERQHQILILWEKTRQLEERLFAGLPFPPDDIIKLLSVEHRHADDNRTHADDLKQF